MAHRDRVGKFVRTTAAAGVFQRPAPSPPTTLPPQPSSAVTRQGAPAGVNPSKPAPRKTGE